MPSCSIDSVAPQAVTSEVDEIIGRSLSAHASVQSATEVQLESLVVQIAAMVSANSRLYALRELKDSGMGDLESKQIKLRFVCEDFLPSLIGIKCFGRLGDEDHGGMFPNASVCEYGSPKGVIFAIIPLTNPIPNSLFKILNCLRTKNSIILSYPSKAAALGQEFVQSVRSVLEKNGLPPDLVLTVHQPASREVTSAYMRHPLIDLVLATGGSGLVRAAQSSGNPCYGVGPGNAPAWVTKSANLAQAAQCIVESKAFDNGIVCGSENNLVVDRIVEQGFIQELVLQGAAVLTGDETARARECWFDESTGSVKTNLIGQTAQYFAEIAKITRSYPIKLNVIRAAPQDLSVLGKEKLAPISSMFMAQDNGLEICINLLKQDGAGHTAVIHCTEPDVIDRFAQAIPAGRILVNGPATFGMMGVTTDIPLSFMVGSGSFGNNITTDNITWKHLINVKRLAYDKHTLR